MPQMSKLLTSSSTPYVRLHELPGLAKLRLLRSPRRREENRYCNSNEQGRGVTTAIRTRGGPCATSNAKPGGGRRIHAVRKRSERSQLVNSPWLRSVDR